MTFQKGKKCSHWKGGKRLDKKGYVMIYMPNHLRASYGYVREHILIAEKALGKPLSPGTQIHHHGAKDDNTKIVICENQEYHSLLHLRTRALKACGHVSWRKCTFCKQYDDLANLIIFSGCAAYHKKCKSIYDKKRYIKTTK